MLVIDYDSKFDVLHYILDDTLDMYGEEDVDNVVVLKDCSSDKIVGYTIMNFKKICQERSKTFEILETLFDVNDVYERSVVKDELN